MKMMNELKHMFLYSAEQKVHIPIDELDKRKNSAILLLTPSIEESSKLMKLPYVYNPSYFQSFYVDRNVMAYIDTEDEDNIDFDEQREEAISESLLSMNKTKFKFDDETSILDRNIAIDVFNIKTVLYYTKLLSLRSIPETINVIVHPSIQNLNADSPKIIKSIYNNEIFSFSTDTEIHILSKSVFDKKKVGMPYDIYLANELIYFLIMFNNETIDEIRVKGIALSLSGGYEWSNNNFNDAEIPGKIMTFSKAIDDLLKKDAKNIKIIKDYIKTGNSFVFSKYILKQVIGNSSFTESELTYYERQKLLPSEFGIPDKRKFPMPDEDHVRAAIRMFNNCDYDEEEELAENINKKIKKFGLTDIKVSAANRFKKYYKPISDRNKNESVISESFINSDYEDILKICSHLGTEEFKKITFYDTYRNSPFVIKRIIHRVGVDPAGFIDVYQFPSNPDIVQIVIAVDDRYRGNGIADAMVKEVINSDLHITHNFSTYYWTAHHDNIPSQNLAIKNGFKYLNKDDNYGRKIFIKKMKNNNEDLWKEIQSHSESFGESAFVSPDVAIFYEANKEKEYSDRLRKYLYKERLKNNKAVLDIYSRIKSMNSDIRRTYPSIKQYKNLNIYIDLSYYHSLFLKNNMYRLDKAVNFYFEFLNRLIDNPEINREYKNRTIFIPIDSGVWPLADGSDLFDFKHNLNPISIIFRLIRTNPSALKKEFGNKNIIFVGSRGYFKVDFNKFELKDLSRFKTNIAKLTTPGTRVSDDFEIDNDVDSTAVISASISDKIIKQTSKPIEKIEKKNGFDSSVLYKDLNHLRLNREPIPTDSNVITVAIHPDSVEGFEKISMTVLSNAKSMNTYLSER